MQTSQLLSNIRKVKLIYYFSIPIPKRKIEKIFTKTEIGHSNITKILIPKNRIEPRKVKNRMIRKSRIELSKGNAIIFASIGYNF